MIQEFHFGYLSEGNIIFLKKFLHPCVVKKVASFFTIARTWKHPKCPLMKDIDRYIHTVAYYPSIKRKEILPLLPASVGLHPRTLTVGIKSKHL